MLSIPTPGRAGTQKIAWGRLPRTEEKENNGKLKAKAR